MLFNFMPDSARLPELPAVLKTESDLQYERLQGKLSPEQFAALEKEPHFRWVLGMSDFLASTLFMYPRECLELIEKGALSDPGYLKNLRAVLDERLVPGLNDIELKHRLRVIRRSFMVPLVWRDLTGAADIGEVFSNLTDLAENIVLKALDVVRAGLVKIYGDALTPEGKPLPLLTFGMGKLGGRELNFSSDLDLIFAYPYDGETSGTPRSITFKEFFSRMVQRLSNILSDNTIDTFCYRIDLRLRPFGDAGAFVNSFDALAEYYETQGRTWERYALVKARILGDGEEQKPYADELYDLLRPFVYRRYLDYGAVQSLRKLKQLIESEVRRRRLNTNFKLGRGGIREVEFIAQVFELMRGGRIPELRERNLRKTLKVLASLQLLPDDVARLLDICYLFLRRLENNIQEFSDKQTQDLPENERDKARVVLCMHKRSWEDFEADLTEIMRAVHAEFSKVVQEEDETPEEHEDTALWENRYTPEELAEGLMPFMAQKEEAVALATEVQTLHRSLSAMPVGPVGRETLRLLMPRVMKLTANEPHPAELFKKVGSLIEKVALRTTYLQLLQENRQTLQRLIGLLRDNAFAGDLIAAHPILLDELIAPQYMTAPPKPEQYLQLLQERLLRVEPDNLEGQMEELRLFKKTMVLRVAMSDKSERLPLMKVSDALTWLAEAVVRELVVLSWEQCVPKYGAPENCTAHDPGLAVIAYGKLGGIELGYKSDLDMVFIRQEDDGNTQGERSVPTAMFYQRLVQRLLHLSTTRTVGGVLYDLDMRLRPDGDSGLLISDVRGFETYQHERAWTWEHQALVRARPIAGSPKVIAAFNEIRDRVLRAERDKDKLREEVLAMRDKMRKHLDRGNDELFDLKQSPGGMVDIEFIAQYLLLREAHSHPDMVLWSDNVRILDECARLNILPEDDAKKLKQAYIAIRRWYHGLSLAELPRVISRDDRPPECADVETIWKQVFGL